MSSDFVVLNFNIFEYLKLHFLCRNDFIAIQYSFFISRDIYFYFSRRNKNERLYLKRLPSPRRYITCGDDR